MALTEAQKRNAERNRLYWEQREAEQLKHNITEEKEFDKQLHKIYADMLDNVQNEINAFYGRYASKEGISIAEAKKRVSALDIKAYERKAKRYVKEKNFSDEANEEMRLYNLTMKVNRLELLKANIGLEMIAGHDEIKKFMEGILQGRTEDELKRQAGILGKTITNNGKAARVIVNGSFRNATFSDRIWQYHDLMRADMSKVLQTGLIQGKNPRAIGKELYKYWYGNDPRTNGGAQYCMERLMRTELARVQTEAQKESFIRNGFSMYTFHVNSGCCDICEKIAKENGGHYMVKEMMPGTNAPPMHPHCRCSTSAYEDTEEYNEWLDYVSKGGSTAEWNKMRAKSSRKDIAKSVKSSILKLNKSVLPMELQIFATGKDRAEKYGNNWTKSSLQKAIEQYANGAEGEVLAEKGKIIYKRENGRYQIVYDYNGDYFRIEDLQKHGKRKYVDIDGKDVTNIKESGKERGRTREEYESATHFKNTDFDGDDGNA